MQRGESHLTNATPSCESFRFAPVPLHQACAWHWQPRSHKSHTSGASRRLRHSLAGVTRRAAILEIERVTGRLGAAARGRADGAASLIGSSAAIRAVRDRIERVAATDFTVLIEGAIGPQPHPSFIEFSGEADLGDGYREVAGEGQDLLLLGSPR